jgi:hypothetical protein
LDIIFTIAGGAMAQEEPIRQQELDQNRQSWKTHIASWQASRVSGGGPRCLDSLMGGISSESVFGFFNFIEKHQAASAKG